MAVWSRSLADAVLFGVTLAELGLLAALTDAFSFAEWMYVSQHLVVLGVALTRSAPQVLDRTVSSGVAVGVAYTYPYAQMVCVAWMGAEPLWPAGGLVLVTIAACLSAGSLVTLGRRFGIRPALRGGVVTTGPYRYVRHPMYVAYVLADVGYNLDGWNAGTLALSLAGWIAIIYRIRAEERVLAHHAGWERYRKEVAFRLCPGLW